MNDNSGLVTGDTHYALTNVSQKNTIFILDKLL